jgi:hypothetical protein
MKKKKKKEKRRENSRNTLIERAGPRQMARDSHAGSLVPVLFWD